MDFEKEYEGRFSTRYEEHIQNMTRLYEITGNLGDGKAISETYPQLKQTSAEDSAYEALLVSLYYAWNEVSECFIYGQYQAVIVLCRSIAERCLKLQFIKVTGGLPAGRMLGNLIQQGTGIIDQNILDLASLLGPPGNDRAHGLLETAEPEVAIRGGKERGVEVLSPSTYLIFPYRGEAEHAIERAHQILKATCG